MCAFFDLFVYYTILPILVILNYTKIVQYIILNNVQYDRDSKHDFFFPCPGPVLLLICIVLTVPRTAVVPKGKLCKLSRAIRVPSDYNITVLNSFNNIFSLITGGCSEGLGVL